MFYFVQKPKNVTDPYEDLRMWEIIEVSDPDLADQLRSGWTTNGLGELVPNVWYYDEFETREDAQKHIDRETERILRLKGWLNDEGFVDENE